MTAFLDVMPDAGHLAAANLVAALERDDLPTRVRHAKFGEENVLSSEGTRDGQKLVVQFVDSKRTLLRRFVER